MRKKLFKESNFKKKALKLLNKEGFYVAIFLCITLVATGVVYFTNNSVNNDIADNNNEEISDSISIDEDTEDVSNILDELEENEDTQENEDTEEDVPKVEENTKDNNDTDEGIEIEETTNEKSQTPESNTVDPLENLVNPVTSDKVIMAFSYGAAPVYSVTLQEFRSDHTGIDLKAELGQEVKAAFDGKVIKIYNDGKLGKTIVIQHGSNVETRYSNLDENISVTLNQSVTAGQSIAKVGKTASFEIEDEPHLHFEVWKDGKCIDPAPYL